MQTFIASPTQTKPAQRETTSLLLVQLFYLVAFIPPKIFPISLDSPIAARKIPIIVNLVMLGIRGNP